MMAINRAEPAGNKNMHQFGVAQTLFMGGEEKHGHHFDLPLFFNMSKQFLALGV